MTEMTVDPARPAAAIATPLPMREAVATNRRARLGDVLSSLRVARIIGARDIKVKYKQSALGPVWLLLQPLGMLAAITIAFSGVTDVQTGGVPYVLFGLVGVAVWSFISMTLAVAPQAFLGNAALVRRSPAPRLAFITATVMSNLPLLGIVLGVTLIATLVDRGLRVEMLVLPLLIAWLLAFSWALVLLIAPVAARFRDAVAIVPLAIQAGIFVSPVGYDLEGAPRNIELLLSINPITGIIDSWRWAILGMPAATDIIAIGVGWTVVLLIGGWYLYGRMEVRLADFV